MPNDGAALRANVDRTSITWIGHATVLVQAGGLSFLTDPVFSDYVGVFERKAPPGVALEHLPPIDFVVISHNHRDHLDERSVKALGPSVHFLVPLGTARWFRDLGLTKVTELDWWDSTTVEARGRHAKITLVPAQHWCQRGATDANRALWGGWVVEAGERRVYFAGDTGYPAAFDEIGKRFPSVDYAILPIGAYEPRWFMSPQHMDPAQAARAFHTLGAHRLVPVHWGTFALTDEPMDEPPRLLREALGASMILQLAIGETYFEP
jgi:L-ascorbate metabolism protein UlaG (beta-lactamase superfamily)